MNLHEELEKFVRENHTNPFDTGFTKSCGVFGGFLKPEASANNVWRWCKKSRVPNRRYHASIRERTGIDFSKCDKKKVHGIPVKTVQAAKKAVETHLPVDFQDLQWVYSETPCVGCFIDGGSDECENAVRAITGLKCKSRNFVLKRKPTWEVCTKQNTKVGDVVRRLDSGAEWTVVHVLSKDVYGRMVISTYGVDDCGPMSLFEVEI